ncbi:MAG: sigma-70 family RNA polymerase sigma factor [Planctomycetes bacterium]|nr:sigma-70 family RNA polymerase sigma factor [Planctomycetota bacterium]
MANVADSTPPSETPEAERKLDDADIDRLVEAHWPSLNAFVRMRTGAKLGRRESISDLVQSTCREVLRSAEKVPGLDESGFRYWLFTMAERKIRNKARHWDAEKRDADRELGGLSAVEGQRLLDSYRGFHSPSRAAVLEEEIERVETAMRGLPRHYAEVIALHHVAGLPHREIATRMDRSEAAVRQLLSKALARLARTLRANERNSPP